MQAQRYPQARKAYQRAEELIARQAAVPENVRVEVKDNLARATACVKMMGFHESIRALPAREQARRLEAKFREVYGPGVKIQVTIEEGSLPGINISENKDLVRWLDPLRGLPLRALNCSGTSVADLGPLKGMSLKELTIHRTKVADLSPLKGMSLQKLNIGLTRVVDLSSLKGMSLKGLNIYHTKVVDLSPLKGMLLTEFECPGTGVSDLSPLEGMKLTRLDLWNCVSLTSLKSIEGMPLTWLRLLGCKALQGDLSALKGIKLTSLDLSSCGSLTSLRGIEGMPLTGLDVAQTKVTDLTPLAGMKLGTFSFRPRNIIKGIEIIRGMKSIGRIGLGAGERDLMAPEEFWKKYDAGEFK